MKPTSVIQEVNGQTVLVDPTAFAMIKAVNKHNCKNTFDMNADRIEHFKNRIVEKGLTADKIVIVVINVDDANGGPIADMLMPGFNWQEFRDRGEIPFARGLATRPGMQDVLESFDKDASEKLKTMDGVAVIVVDHNVAEVF